MTTVRAREYLWPRTMAIISRGKEVECYWIPAAGVLSVHVSNIQSYKASVSAFGLRKKIIGSNGTFVYFMPITYHFVSCFRYFALNILYLSSYTSIKNTTNNRITLSPPFYFPIYNSLSFASFIVGHKLAVKSSQQSQKYSDKSWFTLQPKESCTNIEILYPYLLELSLRWQSQRGNWINEFSATISRNYFYDKKDTKAGPKIHPSNHPRKQPENPWKRGQDKGAGYLIS